MTLGYPIDPNWEDGDEDDEDDIHETEFSFDDVLRAAEDLSWGHGYEIGRRRGWLQAHAELIITMYENMMKAGYPVRTCVQILADAMGVTCMELECLLPIGIGGEKS